MYEGVLASLLRLDERRTSGAGAGSDGLLAPEVAGAKGRKKEGISWRRMELKFCSEEDMAKDDDTFVRRNV